MVVRLVLLLLLFQAAVAELPRRGGILRLGVKSDWRSLDPAIAFDADSIPLQKLLFRGLLNYGPGIELVPDQASEWSVSEDGRTYRFRLRPGVRFSHGREVEAEDYVFSLERILDPKTRSPGQMYFLDIVGARDFNEGRLPHVTGLRAPDRQTFEIELAHPSFTFAHILAMNFADVVPREWVRQYGADFQYHLVGSGPYRVKEWRRDVRWNFERNPYYSGPGGWVDGVEITVGLNGSVSAMMIERGELDRSNADSVSAVRFQRDPRLRTWVHHVQPANTGYLFLNTEVAPFNDLRVREAVSLALDKSRLIRLTGRQCVIGDGIVPSSMPWTNPALPPPVYDPDRARRLLQDAGYPEGFKTALWYIDSRSVDQFMAAGIQQDLKAVGIEIELHGVSYSAFEVKVRTRGQVPCGLWSWVQDFPDPSTFLDTLLNGERITPEDCNNVSFYNNPEFNRRVNEASRISNPARRIQLFQEAEALAVRDCPWVPLYHEQYPVLSHPRLRGDVPHPVWLWRYENMWLDGPETLRTD